MSSFLKFQPASWIHVSNLINIQQKSYSEGREGQKQVFFL